MVADTMDLQFRPAGFWFGSFGFMGATASIDSATVGTGTPIPALTNPVLNAVNNIGQVMEGGVPLSGIFLQSLSLSLANRTARHWRGCSLGNVDIGAPAGVR